MTTGTSLSKQTQQELNGTSSSHTKPNLNTPTLTP